MQAGDVYEFAADGGLTSYLHAQDAQINMDGSWILYNIYQKLIAEGGTTSQHIPQLVLPKLLSREEASMLTLPPETLSLSELYRVIGSLQQRKQNIERYRLVLWQKLTLPLMTAALIILALPFGGRHVRSAGLGWQVTVGAVGGVVFFFLNRILGYTGLIYQLSPAWTTLMPALVLLAAGIYLLAKTN